MSLTAVQVIGRGYYETSFSRSLHDRARSETVVDRRTAGTACRAAPFAVIYTAECKISFLKNCRYLLYMNSTLNQTANSS